VENITMETLKNNSESMKTVVETFLVEETVDLIYDGDKLEKWNGLVSELGLTGQSQIVKTDKSPIPFMHLKKSMINVLKTLCPRKVPIREFNITPIPIEILDLVALSEREQYFSAIQIWYDDAKPDPACVGVIENWIIHIKGTYNTMPNTPHFTSKTDAENYLLVNNKEGDPYHYTWEETEKFYLLGKWADVRHSLDDLKQMATKRYTESQTNELQKIIKDAQRKIEDINSTAFEMFN